MSFIYLCILCSSCIGGAWCFGTARGLLTTTAFIAAFVSGLAIVVAQGARQLSLLLFSNSHNVDSPFFFLDYLYNIGLQLMVGFFFFSVPIPRERPQYLRDPEDMSLNPRKYGQTRGTLNLFYYDIPTDLSLCFFREKGEEENTIGSETIRTPGEMARETSQEGAHSAGCSRLQHRYVLA